MPSDLNDKAGSNIKKYQKELWNEHFLTENKEFKRKNYGFNFMIKTDGIACSVLLIKLDKEIESLKKCKVTKVGLEIPENTTFEEWEKIGKNLENFNSSLVISEVRPKLRWLISLRQQAVQRLSTEVQLDWAKQATVSYFDPNTKWRPRVDVDEFAANLQAMIRECQNVGCRPILVVWPDRRQLQNQPTWRPAYQDAMRNVAHEANVTCLDLVPMFESGGQWAVDRFLPNDVVHLDQVGNEVVSDAVAHVIRKAFHNDVVRR